MRTIVNLWFFFTRSLIFKPFRYAVVILSTLPPQRGILENDLKNEKGDFSGIEAETTDLWSTLWSESVAFTQIVQYYVVQYRPLLPDLYLNQPISSNPLMETPDKAHGLSHHFARLLFSHSQTKCLNTPTSSFLIKHSLNSLIMYLDLPLIFLHPFGSVMPLNKCGYRCGSKITFKFFWEAYGNKTSLWRYWKVLLQRQWNDTTYSQQLPPW